MRVENWDNPGFPGMSGKLTHQVEGGRQDGCVGDGSRLAAVQQELEALHALPDGSQIHHVLVLHPLLAAG